MGIKQSEVTGQQMKEAIRINYGLFVFKQCIQRLKEKNNFIPYGDSRLTGVLGRAGVLGGNSKTMVIITGNLEKEYALETIQTCRFGEECSTLENKTSVQAVLATITDTIKSLDKQIAMYQRRIQQEEQQDALFNPMRTQHMTWAERFEAMSNIASTERQMLETAMKKRRELLAFG